MKYFPALLLLLIASNYTLAQVSLGIKGGFNLVSVDTKTSDNLSRYEDKFGSRPGYHFGAYSQIHLTNKVSFFPELLFSNKGNKVKESNLCPDCEENLHLNYLNFPVLIGYQPLKGLDVMVGPEIGYLLFARLVSSSKSVDVGNFWDKKFDRGICLGLRYLFAEKMGAGIRYNYGLTSTKKDIIFTDRTGNLSVVERIKYQNRALQIYVSYHLL